MAINPELITTIRVDQLPDEALSLTNLFPHTVGTDLKSATIQELVDLVATAIGVSGGVGYIAISVTDGQQLPDVPELPSFFLCGAGTFLNINGYPDVICTDELNAVMSLSDHWQLAVGIPIVAEVGVQTVTGSAVDNTDPLNPIVNLGGSAGTLAETLVLGNITDGTDISISDGDKILLDNGANLKKGTTDAGLGGSKGIALRCAVDYELKWEAGRLYVMGGDGFTIREVSHNFTTTPTVNDDDTKGFIVDSRWILDNGDVYVCTDDTTGAAVWVLQSSGTPTLQEVLDNNHDLVDGNFFAGTTAGNDNTGINVIGLGEYAGYQNTADYVNALGNSAGTGSEGENINAFGFFAGGFNTGNNVNALGYEAGFTNTFNNVNLFGNSASADEDGQTVLSKDGGIMARISTTDLTDTQKYNLPDASGTLALTSDITVPTLQQVTDVGNETTNSIKANKLVTQTNGPSKSMTLSSSNVNSELTAEWQEKNYLGIADITDIPTLVAGTNITIDDTDPLNPIISSTGGGGGGGGGASISFYLNGSVSQGTIGGVAFREMDRTPILGTGTDFTINADGYIQSFITDANVPNLLEIPAGNWNFETYFSASSGGGSPSFYVELYKWNGTTLSLIASNSATPEGITNGTTIDAYFSALAVPQTTLLATDRLAVRIYVTHSGRTITLHTEDNNLCQVITTFSTGLTALNGLTAQVQNLAVGTSGTDFAISSATATHTFNLPTASATNRGALSSTDWSAFNNKPDELQVVLLSQVYS